MEIRSDAGIRGPSSFHVENGLHMGDDRGYLLSLKEKLHRMERIGFGHSFGTVKKHGREGRRDEQDTGR